MERMPWEDEAPVDPLKVMEEKLARLAYDLSIMITHTCIEVQSSDDTVLSGVRMNVPRGSCPDGKTTFKDGTTIEFKDLGMPQPNTAFGSVGDLLQNVHQLATEEGLEL